MTAPYLTTLIAVSLYSTVQGSEVRSLSFIAPAETSASLAPAPCALRRLSASSCDGFEIGESNKCKLLTWDIPPPNAYRVHRGYDGEVQYLGEMLH